VLELKAEGEMYLSLIFFPLFLRFLQKTHWVQKSGKDGSAANILI